MPAILNYLNVHNFLIFQPILMTLVSKFMVQRALSDKTYLLLGLRSPLSQQRKHSQNINLEPFIIEKENKLFIFFITNFNALFSGISSFIECTLSLIYFITKNSTSSSSC